MWEAVVSCRDHLCILDAIMLGRDRENTSWSMVSSGSHWRTYKGWVMMLPSWVYVCLKNETFQQTYILSLWHYIYIYVSAKLMIWLLWAERWSNPSAHWRSPNEHKHLNTFIIDLQQVCAAPYFLSHKTTFIRKLQATFIPK